LTIEDKYSTIKLLKERYSNTMNNELGLKIPEYVGSNPTSPTNDTGE